MLLALMYFGSGIKNYIATVCLCICDCVYSFASRKSSTRVLEISLKVDVIKNDIKRMLLLRACACVTVCIRV